MDDFVVEEHVKMMLRGWAGWVFLMSQCVCKRPAQDGGTV